MTSPPFIQELKAYGYSEIESCFLQLVALHSGVFLRRHFMRYAHVTSGKRVDSFMKKLKSNSHCHTYPLNKNASVFHLTSRAIYRAVGHENLRHRRSHRVDYVKTKLLSLDYILDNPDRKYLPTEEDKIHLFAKVLGIPLSDLPARAYTTPNGKAETLRYFVDKFPLFLSEISLSVPVVHFTYVDPGPYTSIVDFLSHLRMYARLFAQMEVIRMVYIYYVSNKWKQAQDLFHCFVRSGCKVDTNDLDLVKYFQIREAWESKQYEKVGATELLFLGQAKKKYLGSKYEALYGQWKNGDRTFPAVVPETKGRVPASSFTTYKIGETYAIFGDLD
jgi:hypothetical protein